MCVLLTALKQQSTLLHRRPCNQLHATCTPIPTGGLDPCCRPLSSRPAPITILCTLQLSGEAPVRRLDFEHSASPATSTAHAPEQQHQQEPSSPPAQQQLPQQVTQHPPLPWQQQLGLPPSPQLLRHQSQPQHLFQRQQSLPHQPLPQHPPSPWQPQQQGLPPPSPQLLRHQSQPQHQLLRHQSQPRQQLQGLQSVDLFSPQRPPAQQQHGGQSAPSFAGRPPSMQNETTPLRRLFR